MGRQMARTALRPFPGENSARKKIASRSELKKKNVARISREGRANFSSMEIRIDFNAKGGRKIYSWSSLAKIAREIR